MEQLFDAVFSYVYSLEVNVYASQSSAFTDSQPLFPRQWIMCNKWRRALPFAKHQQYVIPSQSTAAAAAPVNDRCTPTPLTSTTAQPHGPRAINQNSQKRL